MRQIACVVALALVLATTPAYGHSGGTDANGCHTDSSTGTRHCHGGSGSTSGGGGDSSDVGLVVGVVLGVGAIVALVAILVAYTPSPTRPTGPPEKKPERKPVPDNGDWDFKVDGNPDGVWLIMEGRW